MLDFGVASSEVERIGPVSIDVAQPSKSSGV
jgi:hypothetical protein